ncbi:hypothetical protein PENSPDRAFT_748262 [Peniophora sp. CONT]|nr:hypothetical protein PENSPDRAFT_748262 [Peniophora sp. CONT]
MQAAKGHLAASAVRSERAHANSHAPLFTSCRHHLPDAALLRGFSNNWVNFSLDICVMLLVDLPVDVLELICSQLDAYSAVACSSACKHLRSIITTSLSTRYTIALAMRGMRAGGNESVSLAERLQKLERYETAWLEGSWKKSFKIDLPAPTRHVYHAEGYFLAWNPDSGQVHAARLPSELRGITLEEYRWEWFPSTNTGLEITVLLDVTNDMAMFIEICGAGNRSILHPRRLSSGSIHPSVWPNELIVLDDADITCTDFCLRNNFILARFAEVHDGVAAFNWVAQQRILKIESRVSCVTFLDDSRILASFVYRPEPGITPVLRVFDLLCDKWGGARMTHELVLPLRDGLLIPEYDFCIGRQCGFTATRSDVSDKAQYFSDDDWTVLYHDPTAKTDRYFGFVMYLCISELNRLTKEPSCPVDTTILPWRLWGHAARLGLDYGSLSIREVGGSRMYGPKVDATHFWIHDYHPARIRRARTHPSSDLFSVEQYADVLDIAILREDELEPGAPLAPRSPECVDHYVSFMAPDDPESRIDYDPVLSGDVVLVREKVVSNQPVDIGKARKTRAITAYSLE